jgi:hypothetical protein
MNNINLLNCLIWLDLAKINNYTWNDDTTYLALLVKQFKYIKEVADFKLKEIKNLTFNFEHDSSNTTISKELCIYWNIIKNISFRTKLINIFGNEVIIATKNMNLQLNLLEQVIASDMENCLKCSNVLKLIILNEHRKGAVGIFYDHSEAKLIVCYTKKCEICSIYYYPNHIVFKQKGTVIANQKHKLALFINSSNKIIFDSNRRYIKKELIYIANKIDLAIGEDNINQIIANIKKNKNVIVIEKEGNKFESPLAYHMILSSNKEFIGFTKKTFISKLLLDQCLFRNFINFANNESTIDPYNFAQKEKYEYIEEILNDSNMDATTNKSYTSIALNGQKFRYIYWNYIIISDIKKYLHIDAVLGLDDISNIREMNKKRKVWIKLLAEITKKKKNNNYIPKT